jgi:hypothetical protein
MSDTNTTKTVPPRNDFRAEPVFVKGSIVDQAGFKPGYHRQWFNARDVNSRGHYERYLKPQYIGDPHIGYCKAEAWSVVPRDEAKPGRKRDDDTSGIETALTHGDMVCLETTLENYAIWQKADELRSDARDRAMRAGEVETTTADDGNGRATFAARLGSTRANESAVDAARALLNSK